MRPSIFLWLTSIAFMASTAFAATYKYKDANGKWVFTDKKPEATQAEEVLFKTQKKASGIQPKVSIRSYNNAYTVVAENPFGIDIELELLKEQKRIARQVIPANEAAILLSRLPEKPTFQYRWIFGNPNITINRPTIALPFDCRETLKVTQGFGGSFSHNKQPSYNAIDIGMPVGTFISSVADGVVLRVKDGYSLSGRSSYFLDKANHIIIGHKDGTYSMYAHLLEGTFLVKPGDKVKQGQRIARSGSSGYSTGPHLHFALYRNNGMKQESVPFRFKDPNNRIIRPEKGTTLFRSTEI